MPTNKAKDITINEWKQALDAAGASSDLETMLPADGWYTSTELAELLGLSRATAVRRIRKMAEQSMVEIVTGRRFNVVGTLKSLPVYKIKKQPKPKKKKATRKKQPLKRNKCSESPYKYLQTKSPVKWTRKKR